MNVTNKSYAAVVIGGGPAGLAAVSRLLDTHTTPIVWVDPAFQGGRLIKYKEVPSNTKVKLFLKFARASPSLVSAFEHRVKTHPHAPSSSLSILEKMDPEKGCFLSFVQSMCEELTSCLFERFPSALTPVRGWVKDIHFDPTTLLYTCATYPDVRDSFEGIPDPTFPPPLTLEASTLILCTGSEPIVPPPSSTSSSSSSASSAPPDPPRLPLDVCLTPSLLRTSAPAGGTFHVVGGSHSAVLCLKHLVEGVCPTRVYLETRHPFVYAEENKDDGSILHDNTGLKLVAADFARSLTTNPALAAVVHLGRPTTAEETAHRVDAKVFAIGFEPRATVCWVVEGQRCRVTYDPATGQLSTPERALPRAFGFGIGFPERVRDRSGEWEWNVGLWKFMKYIQRVL